MPPPERLEHFIKEEDSDLRITVTAGRKLGARSEQHDRLDHTRSKITAAAVDPGMEVFPQHLPGKLDAVEDRMIMVKLELDQIAGILRIGGLEKEVAPDFELLQNPGRTPATLGQGQPGEFAQPLGMVAEEFMKDAIGVHVIAIRSNG